MYEESKSSVATKPPLPGRGGKLMFMSDDDVKKYQGPCPLVAGHVSRPSKAQARSLEGVRKAGRWLVEPMVEWHDDVRRAVGPELGI